MLEGRLPPAPPPPAVRTSRRRAIALGLLAVLTAAMLVACNDGEDEEPDAEDVDPQVVLDEAADRMEEVESFAFELEHVNGFTTIVLGLQMLSAEGVIDGTERLRADIGARAGPVNVDVGVIVLPDQGWITNPLTGQWQRQDNLDVAQFFDPGSGVTALMRDIEEPRLSGTESINGVRTYRIEADVDSGMLAQFAPEGQPGRTVLVRSWIGIDDPVVHRVELVGPLESGDGDNVVRRLTLSEFDGEFEIEPPR